VKYNGQWQEGAIVVAAFIGLALLMALFGIR
jgi:hypothetical protein